VYQPGLPSALQVRPYTPFAINKYYVPETHIMYGTLYGAVDFLNVLKKGCWGGGVLLVHNEIHYLPIGDGWEEVLVRNVLPVHYVPVLHYVPITHTPPPPTVLLQNVQQGRIFIL
jgi:hypothetical protein